MNEVAEVSKVTQMPVRVDEARLIEVLRSSLFPGAADTSIRLVLDYCRAAGLDPMQKPVHIVPMYDRNAGGMRDVIMPGIGLYRIQAARTGEYAGVSEPQFGPDVSEILDSAREIVYPEYCKVTVKRRVQGELCEFTAIEYWKENYATAKRDTRMPNSMWAKRPRGQLAKCAEAQALRKAFPEIGAAPTADEMEGKEVDSHALTSGDKKLAIHLETCEAYATSITAIKEGIATGNYSRACEAWTELSTEVKEALWVAPTKGGKSFTTSERAFMKTPEFRAAFTGQFQGDEPTETAE